MRKFNKEIILFSILACLWAVQAAVLAQQLLGFWHLPLLFSDSLLPKAAGRMTPKWDVLIYLVFVAVALSTGKILFKYAPKFVNGWVVVFEGALTFLMVSALFKILVYFNSPSLAQSSLIALCVLSIASKIFYPELRRLIEGLYQQSNKINLNAYADTYWVVLIALMIYMPDVERVAAMMFIGEYFHHLDAFIMSAGYSFLCGLLPSVDVFSEYGIGLPVIFAQLTHAGASFDYVTVIRLMMFFGIVYFILTYYFVRYWLKSALIAGVVFLLVFRLQMFHFGVSPLIWCVASASPIRFGLDILWIIAILQHLRSGQRRWLIGASLYSGFALYYMTSSGLCVAATFYAYLIALIILPSFRRQWLPDFSKRLCYWLCWFLPIVVAMLFLWMTLGAHIFQKEFWHNLVGYMVIFSKAGAMPMFESLKYRYFWAFAMSLAMPLTYLSTLLYVGVGLYSEKKPREWLLVVLLCIYGLANYQYYVVRSAVTSYYVNALPFVLVGAFWFMHVLEFLPLLWQKRLKAAALVLSFYALLTNQNYLAYPNILNLSRNPLTDNMLIQRFPDRLGYFNGMVKGIKEDDKLARNNLGTVDEGIRTEDDFKNDADLKDYFHQHFDFSQDAAMIRKLTAPSQRVAVISSFEIKILMQAKRVPFFYHFPLLTSRLMTSRSFPTDAARLPSYLGDTLRELKEHHPEYVFMEKVFMEDSLPVSYQEKKATVLAIVDYVKAHYQPFQYGQYLVALKRI